jgi:hypothetical protein
MPAFPATAPLAAIRKFRLGATKQLQGQRETQLVPTRGKDAVNGLADSKIAYRRFIQIAMPSGFDNPRWLCRDERRCQRGPTRGSSDGSRVNLQ